MRQGLCMIPRFYYPNFLNNSDFDYKQCHHLKNVLRIKLGQKVILFDGNGGETEVRIVSSLKSELSFERIGDVKFISRENIKKITIAQALCQKHRMDYIVQKSAELGVESIIPIVSSRCLVKLVPSRIPTKIVRWQSISNGASQQCGRNKVTKICNPMSFDEFIKKKYAEDTELIALSPQGNIHLTDLYLENKQNIFLLIGPEAGLSDLEEEKALLANFKPLQLGKRILRVETASVAAISAINVLTGDF